MVDRRSWHLLQIPTGIISRVVAKRSATDFSFSITRDRDRETRQARFDPESTDRGLSFGMKAVRVASEAVDVAPIRLDSLSPCGIRIEPVSVLVATPPTPKKPGLVLRLLRRAKAR